MNTTFDVFHFNEISAIKMEVLLRQLYKTKGLKWTRRRTIVGEAAINQKCGGVKSKNKLKTKRHRNPLKKENHSNTHSLRRLLWYVVVLYHRHNPSSFENPNPTILSRKFTLFYFLIIRTSTIFPKGLISLLSCYSDFFYL